jgi:nitrate/TMAO reductase-like tetraheme cytochrome c subunit
VDVHPRNYLHLHQFDVFSGQTECATCHDLRQSCDGCHARSWGRIVDHRNMINGTQSCKSCHRGK